MFPSVFAVSIRVVVLAFSVVFSVRQDRLVFVYFSGEFLLLFIVVLKIQIELKL